MVGLEAWLGECHLRARDGVVDYQCCAAVWADSAEAFRSRLAEHVAQIGYGVFCVGDILPAPEYLARHLSTARETSPLARAVNPAHLVELGKLGAMGGDGAPTGPTVNLCIETLESVEPLDMQIGVWPRLNVPEALQEPLFGQPEPTEAEIARYGNFEAVPSMKTYAILDAAKLPNLLTGLLEASQLQYQSLFQGEAQGELKEQAPYLVELKEDNSFTRQLFTGPEGVNGLWDKELGIYIRSRAPFADIRKHFRKFTRVQDEDGKWFLFRFWDSKVSRFYLENIDAQRSHGKLRYIFSDIICNWVTCETGTNTIFGLGKTEGSIDKAFQLNQNDYSIFSDFSWKKYLDKLLRTLRSEHADLYSLCTKGEIVEIAEQARKQNFRTEIAAYNYVRSCLTAYQLKLNFQTMLAQTAGGSPTEHARRLWHVVCNHKNEGQHNA